MKTRIVAIGNSRGIRIPKPLIEEAGLSDEVEISVENGTLAIRPATKPRAGWAAALRRWPNAATTLCSIPTRPSTDWDKDQWEW